MEIIKLGSLYMNGVKVQFTGTTRTSYIDNSPLEFRTQDADDNYKISWLKVDNGVKQYLIATNGLLNNISYDSLSRQGLVNGQIITLESVRYKLRLPTGGTSTRINGDKNSSCLPTDNDYDKYFCNEIGLNTLPLPTGQDKTLNGYDDSTIITSISNGILNWYGSSTLTKDKVGYDITIRGSKNSIQYYDTINQFAKSVNVMYRPILEVYNEPPIISGQNKYLNSYTSSFKQSYTISDGDADLMKVEEFIDNTLLRTLENETTGFTSSVDLSTVWDSLSYNTHTITIKVTDSFGNEVSRIYTFTKLQILSGQTDTLTKPLITTTNNSGILLPINALEENYVLFNVVGGDIVYYNEINIVDNSDGTTIYNKKSDQSFDFKSIILKNMLTNGKEYQVKIRTYNDNNQYSAWSNICMLKAFSSANIIINGIINGQITTQNPLITASFSQSDTYLKDGISITTSDTLYSYQFTLLKDGQTITESPVLTDSLLRYQFSSLENKTNYTIKLITLTNGNVQTITEESFYCLYQQSRMTALLEVKSEPLTGSVVLNVFAKQIRGRIEIGTAQYIDGESIDLHDGIAIFDKDSPFKVDGDFTMKLWARDLEDNNAMLFKISNDICDITLTRFGNEFWIKKYVNNVLLYEKYDSVSGDINAEDELFFFVQHEASTGLMNFQVTRDTDGTTTWYKPQTVNDLPPSTSHTTYNAYDKEDGFLTNFSDGLRSLIIPVSIDGVNTNVYLPSLDNLVGNNAYSLFKNMQPIEDTNYSEDRNILGEYIIGTSLLGSETDTNSNISIRIKNNYTGSNPLNIKYKLFDYVSSTITIYEKIDGIVFNTRRNINEPEELASEFVLDLTNYWDSVSYGEHSLEITLVDNTGYNYTKTLSFSKGADKIGLLKQSAIDKNTNTTLTLTEGQAYKYYTRTVDSVDSNKLSIINSDGSVNSEYPKAIDMGERVVLNLPIGTRCTTYKDSIDNCYIVTTKLNNIFTTQTLGDLRVGDKIKECFTIYSNDNIEFTIVDKNEIMVTVITDIITIKPYDVAESVLINGDAIWNDSNIKQWLNSNDELVRRK